MSVDVPGMCKNSLYTVDLLILPSDLLIYASVADSMLKLGRIATKNQHLTAVLIHTPEHYERNQAKRIDIREAKSRKIDFITELVIWVIFENLTTALEPVCCKKRQKKSKPRNWFGE